MYMAGLSYGTTGDAGTDSLHVVDGAQLGINEDVQAAEQVIEQFNALPLEVVAVPLPLLFLFPCCSIGVALVRGRRWS
jgi:hypothetical protein